MSTLGAITLLVILVGGIYIWYAKPARATATYLAIVVLWPDGVTLAPAGGIAFTPAKVLILVLMAALIIRHGRHRTFQMNGVDWTMTALFLFQWLAAFSNLPFGRFAEYEGNVFLSNGLIYYGIRLTITSREEFATIVRVMTRTAAFIAVLAVYESITMVDPYESLIYTVGGYHWLAPGPPPRFGFQRAMGGFRSPLALGMFLACMVPLSMCFVGKENGRDRISFLWTPVIFCGLIATWSSGPLFSALAGLIIVACYRMKPVAIAGVVFMGAWSILSFFGVPSLASLAVKYAFNSVNAQYRLNLIKEAFGGAMRGHWVTGYGLVGLGTGDTGSNFAWTHTDFVNVFVYRLVIYGLLGMIPYILVNIALLHKFSQGSRWREDRVGDWLFWVLFATFIAWSVGLWSVAPLRQFEAFFYAAFGFIGCMYAIVVVRTPEVVMARAAPRPASTSGATGEGLPAYGTMPGRQALEER